MSVKDDILKAIELVKDPNGIHFKTVDMCAVCKHCNFDGITATYWCKLHKRKILNSHNVCPRYEGVRIK